MRECAWVLIAIAATPLMSTTAFSADRPAPAPVAESLPQAAPAGAGSALDQQEQQARADATVALVRLELVLGRKALRDGQYDEATRKAHRAAALMKQLPTGTDASEYELQAEGILVKAARKGVNMEALRRDPPAPATSEFPPSAHAQKPEATAAETARPRVESSQAPDRYGYRPSQHLVDRDALTVRDGERVYCQAALEGAYKDSETRALVEAQEARVIPEGIVSYPPDWPEKMKKREQYRGGMVARGPSWVDQQGREWYVAVYDIHDLMYVPPDFVGADLDPLAGSRDALDRDALRWHSDIFRGGADDLAAGIPLLRYFGGVNDWVFRGPKYSLERQREVVELIQAFTAPPAPEAKIVPLPP